MKFKITYFMKSIVGVTALVMLMSWASQSLAQPARAVSQTNLQADYILKVCQETEFMGRSIDASHGIDPAYMLKNFLYNYSNGKQVIDLASVKTSLRESTTHGHIFAEVDNVGLTSYHYDPTTNYIGNDKAVFMAEFQGKGYRIEVDIHVVRYINDSDEPTTSCPSPKLIKLHH